MHHIMRRIPNRTAANGFVSQPVPNAGFTQQALATSSLYSPLTPGRIGFVSHSSTRRRSLAPGGRAAW